MLRTVRFNCTGPGAGEVMRMRQEADVVHAHHHRYARNKRSGVLHVQQIGTVLEKTTRQIESQTRERVRRHQTRGKTGGNLRASTRPRDVGDELIILPVQRKTLQKIANVRFIAGEVLSNRVGVN